MTPPPDLAPARGPLDGGPAPRRWSTGGMVCAVDHLAASAGAALLRAGGSAADAAVGASAVLAVTSQHLCGMGGDLLAVVVPPPGGGDGRAPGALPVSLLSVGPAGAGADADALRAEGHRALPFRDDIRTVTVPGCVDGWLALHDRFGRLPLAEVLAPAVAYASDGFPVSPTLAMSLPRVLHLEGADDYRAAAAPGGSVQAGAIVRRPGVAGALLAIGSDGRDGYYGGAFGTGLLALAGGYFAPSDLARSVARWAPALSTQAWGHHLWSAPPVSQGYLTLASAWMASRTALPADPDDPRWAHLLVEAARQAGYDRLDALHEDADGAALLSADRLRTGLDAISADRAGPSPAGPGEVYGDGDTTAVCVVDAERMGVSLIQSNASGFGAHLVVPGTRIFLHNRGIGFSLDPASPAAYGPGRRPPHTLSPLAATDDAGALRLVAGTMGGDAQPQILLQLVARILAAGQDPADAVAAGRFALALPGPGPRSGFDTWTAGGEVCVEVEGHAAAAWADGLAALGHEVVTAPAWSGGFGHAHAIAVAGGGPDATVLRGGSDPRALGGAAVST